MRPGVVSYLAGTYMLLNRTTTENGNPVPEVAWGSGSNGVMIYGPAGYMSTTVASTDERLLPSDLDVTYPFQEGQTDADWARTGKHTLSYTGPYIVENNTRSGPGKETGVVIHGPLMVAHIPSMTGTLQERNYTVIKTPKGKFLEIRQENSGVRSQLWWEGLD